MTDLTRIAFYSAAGAALFAVAVGASALQEAAHPATEGAEYLSSRGYSSIEGGARSHFNGCGKQMGREYTVTNQDGRRETATVCFGLFGPHRPLFGR